VSSHKSNNINLGQIPESARRSPFTMGMVWLTMVTLFPTVLVGFQWFKQGISLSQMIVCSILSCLLLLAYAIPASQLGARSGRGYCALSRLVFGLWGTRLVTGNLLWVFTAFYGMTACLMAQALNNYLNLHLPVVLVSMLFAVIMAFNNFFGFSGVANFARFFAAPALVGWVGYTFFKAISASSLPLLVEPPHQSMMCALTTMSSFIIGIAVWGNEADYWKFSQPGSWKAGVPMASALLIGQVIFPLSGWLVARSSGITDYAVATTFMSSYSFGGFAVIGLIVLAASYFAGNDSNLFGSIEAIESTWAIKHRLTVIILAIFGAITAGLLSVTDSAKALDTIAALNCIFMPTPTVIMLTEWFLRNKVFNEPLDFSYLPDFSELPAFRWSAIVALLSGILVGVTTSGLIPLLEPLHVGICPVQAWLIAAVVYALLRQFEYRQETSRTLLLKAQLVKSERSDAIGADV
jgi:purine-cytosine permease-like protein